MVHPPSKTVSRPKDKSYPDLYPLMRLHLDVVQSIRLGGVDRDFPFIDDETRRHFSYLSGVFREQNYQTHMMFPSSQLSYLFGFN